MIFLRFGSIAFKLSTNIIEFMLPQLNKTLVTSCYKFRPTCMFSLVRLKRSNYKKNRFETLTQRWLKSTHVWFYKYNLCLQSEPSTILHVKGLSIWIFVQTHKNHQEFCIHPLLKVWTWTNLTWSPFTWSKLHN